MEPKPFNEQRNITPHLRPLPWVSCGHLALAQQLLCGQSVAEPPCARLAQTRLLFAAAEPPHLRSGRDLLACGGQCSLRPPTRDCLWKRGKNRRLLCQSEGQPIRLKCGRLFARRALTIELGHDRPETVCRSVRPQWARPKANWRTGAQWNYLATSQRMGAHKRERDLRGPAGGFHYPLAPLGPAYKLQPLESSKSLI